MDPALKVFVEKVLKLAEDFEKETKSKLESIDICRARLNKDGTYDEKLDSCPVIFYAKQELGNGGTRTLVNGMSN